MSLLTYGSAGWHTQTLSSLNVCVRRPQDELVSCGNEEEEAGGIKVFFRLPGILYQPECKHG